jgi:hypothetical protein
MTKDSIPLTIFLSFFVLYFFATQKIYNSTYFYRIALLISILSLGLFVFVDRLYPELKVQYSAFVIFYYGVLLILVKLIYSKLNMSLIQKEWIIGKQFMNKDFTFTTITDWGDSVWDKKIAVAPSWLDHFVSIVLLFGPMLLMWLTVSVMRG